MPASGLVVASAADTSPSAISLMRAPGAAHLVDQLLVPRPVEDDDGQVLDVDALRLGERAAGSPSGSGRGRSTPRPSGPQAIFSM